MIGTYGTLDEALEGVEPYTTIYLTEGVYSITEPITKPGLIIEKRDKDEKVYIIGNEGPVIKVELESGDFINYVTFKNLIIHVRLVISESRKDLAFTDRNGCTSFN